MFVEYSNPGGSLCTKDITSYLFVHHERSVIEIKQK